MAQAWWQSVAGESIGVFPDEIDDLTHDSRLAGPGVAFIAVPGTRVDGHDFLVQVAEAGAPAAVVQGDRKAQWEAVAERLPLLVVPDTRASMGVLAAAVHGWPSRKLRTIGVTGTDGKTTTTHLLAHVLNQSGLEAGYLTSVGFDSGKGFELNALHMTTMEGTQIQSRLADAAANGRKTMVVEASSEGLAQHRLEGCEIDVAVFTNLSRDHLDFHGTMENYRAAKGLLFSMLERPTAKSFPRAAVLNADDPASEYFRSLTQVPVITYGREKPADLLAKDIESGSGLRFRATGRFGDAEAFAPLVGVFNVSNCLASVGVAISQGVSLADAITALASFRGVPGRLERIDAGQSFAVYVDIASTEAALSNVLRALRPATTGRLIVVFGAAGGRDPARREGLAHAAAAGADYSILTNEDPRDEDPDAIIEAIAAALRDAGKREGTDFEWVSDRELAIGRAFALARAGDSVLLAGKATETTMIFSDGPRPWDERATARRLLGR